MASRLLVLAVLVLAGVAAADSFRTESERRVEPSARTEAARVAPRPTSEYVADGARTRTHVLRHGRPYLSATDIDAAFPAPLEGVPFDIVHVAAAPDRTLALAIYKLPPTGRIRAAIELWRDKQLVGAFTVPARSVGGGLGFTVDGELVATVPRDGLNAILFTRTGDEMGEIPVTSW